MLQNDITVIAHIDMFHLECCAIKYLLHCTKRYQCKKKGLMTDDNDFYPIRTIFARLLSGKTLQTQVADDFPIFDFPSTLSQSTFVFLLTILRMDR